MTTVHAKNQIFILNYAETTLLKNNSANMGIKLYNKLPNTIKRLDKMQEFKKKTELFFNATHFLLSG